MAYDINFALERLEKNLSEVNSAAAQVKDTIASSEKLQHVVTKYSYSLKALNAEISAFVAELKDYQSIRRTELDSDILNIKSTCDKVIDEFKKEVMSTTTTFNTKLSETAASFSKENVKFTEQVGKLHSLYSSLEEATEEIKQIESKIDTISKQLKNSQLNLDKVLGNINKQVTALPNFTKSKIDEVIRSIQSQTQDLKGELDPIQKEICTTLKKLDDIDSTCNGTRKTCHDIKTSIDNLKATIESSSLSMKKSMKNAIVINCLISIAAIIIIAILYLIK